MTYDHICPKCGEDCSTVALIDLVYTFEPHPTENELIETIWHRKCFISAQQPNTADGLKCGFCGATMIDERCPSCNAKVSKL